LILTATNTAEQTMMTVAPQKIRQGWASISAMTNRHTFFTATSP